MSTSGRSDVDHLEQLRKWLRLEREADFEYYRNLVAQLSLEQRRKKGYTWQPVLVQKSGYTFGERAFVIVERSRELDQPHQFRAGKTVNLYVQGEDRNRQEQSGILQFAERNRMKIVLNSRDIPDWINETPLGVDLLFDERSYQEMDKALGQVLHASNNRLAELRRVLCGLEAPRFRTTGSVPELPMLNASQQEAVGQILCAQDLAVIHGPPGTGKTTTLVQAIRLLCQQEHTVLVCAPSNTAVDLLTERLSEQGLAVLRIGNISRVDESIVRHTLEARMAEHPESKHIRKVRKEAAETRRKARKFRRKFGREEHAERRHLYQQAGELDAWATQLEQRLSDEIITRSQVITCTLVGSAHPVLEGRRFQTLVIDEAAQALEPGCWIPIGKVSKVVLAGDPFQLPPTIKSEEARRKGLSHTLIERCIQFWPGEMRLLQVQYRMHETIMNFSNRRFYQGALIADETVRRHRLSFFEQSPVVFIDTAGCGFDEQMAEESLSRFNPEEFQILCEHLYLLSDLAAMGGVPVPEIALISPYREQVNYMEQQQLSDSRLTDLPLAIHTIDSFQGQERDVVYISLVRANGKNEIGFLRDYRRMNVAMTRARKLLVVVGDSATIGADPFYQDFLDYVEVHGHYQTAWEYMQ